MQPTVTLLTPRGRGAVASLRLVGDAFPALEAVFTAANGYPVTKQQIGHVAFGYWGEEEPREDVVLCRISEGSTEVHCHGGNACVDRVLNDLTSRGVVRVESSLDEAQQALRHATTLRTAAILVKQSRLWSQWIEQTLKLEDCAAIAAKVGEVLEQKAFGLHLTEPWQVAIVGPPNVGKSTLLNAIVGFERSIVFDQPGTTRDVVSVRTVIDGWPVVFSDTAGLRDATDGIERAGISAAKARAEEVDLLIEVVDLSSSSPVEGSAGPGVIRVGNKADLATSASASLVDIALSALTGDGVEQLLAEIAMVLVPVVPADDVCVPVSDRQVDWLENIRAACDSDSLSEVRHLVDQASGTLHRPLS